jgi:hypothetical protein
MEVKMSTGPGDPADIVGLVTERFDCVDGHESDAASDRPRNTSIYDATEDCRSSLQSCLTKKELMINEWAENRLADFNLWASGVGASAKLDTSLDTRLSSEPGAHEVVTGLLRTLKAYIEQCQQIGRTP